MKVLLVDDDDQVLEAVTVALRFHWQDIEIRVAHDGQRGIELFYEQNPDVVVLDLSMPEKTGLEVLSDIRRVSDVPVVMLTGRGSETDQVRGLELGADDYIVKPFSHLTLLARIKAVVRRAKLPPPTRSLPDFESGDLTVDFEAREVRVRAQTVPLTAGEYKLVYHLARNAGRVVPYQALLERVWGSEWGATLNNLKALVSRVRSKVEPGQASPQRIENVRGVGYRLLRTSADDADQAGGSQVPAGGA